MSEESFELKLMRGSQFSDPAGREENWKNKEADWLVNQAIDEFLKK